MAISIGIGNYIRSSLYRGTKKNPFHPSLVDYWNFAGKKNSDTDRAIIKGIKGNILNAYNFGWSLSSGYGLYKTNFLQWEYVPSRGTATVTSDTIHLTETFSNSNLIEFNNLSYKFENITVDVSGDFGGVNLIYIYYLSETESSQIVINTPGRYELPKTNRVNSGFKTNRATKLDLTIKQIPEYEGAIVTDGIDDYLKLGKVGYKIGTVIVKYVPIKFNAGWNTVFDNNRYDTPNRNYLGYSLTIENRGTTMFVSEYGDYLALYYKATPKQADDSLYIGSSYTKAFVAKEFFSMALFEMAIYSEILTDEEIQKEIDVMQYGTPNPVFALNFDNFAYKAVDYPDFATGKVTTNKIVVDSTTETFNGAIAVAMNPEADTGDPIEVPSYKIKVTGLNQYNVGEDNWAVGLMGMIIDSTKDPWTYLISKDGVYDIPAISLSDGIYNLGIMAQIAIDKPIEIEILYDKNITKSFPETKQTMP